jgi:hypothetical protein
MTSFCTTFLSGIVFEGLHSTCEFVFIHILIVQTLRLRTQLERVLQFTSSRYRCRPVIRNPENKKFLTLTNAEEVYTDNNEDTHGVNDFNACSYYLFRFLLSDGQPKVILL